jgi:hypothetical protein
MIKNTRKQSEDPSFQQARCGGSNNMSKGVFEELKCIAKDENTWMETVERN